MSRETFEVSTDRVNAGRGYRPGQGLRLDKLHRGIAQRKSRFGVAVVARGHPRLDDIQAAWHPPTILASRAVRFDHDLICPICGSQLADGGSAARCAGGHSFDFARAGYLNLAPTKRRRRVGDSAEMVGAREQFLDRGFFGPVVNAVAGLAVDSSDEPELIAELGSGAGHCLEAITTAVSARSPRRVVGMDLSTAAARSASRRVPDSLFVVADLQEGIPLRSGSADLVVSVFAPARHLRPCDTRRVDCALDLERGDLELLIGMGPSARHRTPERLVEGRRARVSVVVASFRRLPARGDPAE